MSKAIAIAEAIPYRPEEDSFDFHKSWAGLRHACGAHKWLILATCLLTLGLTVLYVRVWPPVFVAEVVVVGESDKDRSRENFYGMWAVFRNGQLTDEAQMITAAPVLQEVIDKLHLTDREVYRSFFGHIGYLWSTSWIGNTYRDFKNWLFPPVRGPYDPSPAQVKAARTLTDLKSGVQLDRVMETNIGRLIVRGPTPRVAEIANTIVAVYLDQRRQRQVREAEAAYDALNEELRKARQETADIEAAMRKYYNDNGLLLSFERDKIEIGQVQTLKAAIAELQAGITGNEQALQQVDAELSKERRDVVASRVIQANPLRDTLRDKLSALQIQRRQIMITYRPGSPEVTNIDRQIGILQQQLGQEPNSTLRQTTTVLSSRYEELRGRAAALRVELAGQRANLAAKTELYARLQGALQSLPEKMRAVHAMEREHGASERKLTAIQEKMMMAAVSRATAQTAYSTIRVVEPAAAPAEPAWPRTKLLLLIALVVGLVAGVLLALLMDLFFGRVHRFRLAGSGWDLPIYAIVQRDRALARDLFALPEPTRPAVRNPHSLGARPG